MINPKPFLYGLVNKRVCVRLKWGETEYEGSLASVDSYMNLQLEDTEEYLAGVNQGFLGEVLIRCNNVLWVGEAKPREASAAQPVKKEASVPEKPPKNDVDLAA